ncbi:MAG: ABC transporter ATP-binding protein [Burkholderiales bacterium]|nr:ABC transporter ATP-binding protein [Burkholderiales bacterium]
MSVHGAPSLQTIGLTKRFGDFVALDAVDLGVRPGTVHALLGENGAGKSTLVKCLVGYHRPDAGSILVDGRERDVGSPQAARALGVGMVYQHFTLVPSMTVAENFALARGGLKAVVDWPSTIAAMRRFLDTTPFTLPLEVPVSALAAGQKQKAEILKQLYADNRLLILDEPTSVLAPDEADEVLGAIRSMAHAGRLTVVMITHKFREVAAFADDVTVLRRGRRVAGGHVGEFDAVRLADAMIGAARRRELPPRDPVDAGVAPALVVERLSVADDTGRRVVRDASLAVRPGEVLGIAGVSGNGQRELVETLLGQRGPASGAIRIGGERYRGRRAEIARHRIGSLPEEPLRNACVAAMSVAENLALREFDAPPLARGGWLSPSRMSAAALPRIEAFGVKTRGPDSPIGTLSGGNVQRAVLARELSRGCRVLVVMTPVCGLDFAAVDEIHRRLLEARNGGAAVLLVSEDLDELIELSDRVVVMSEGALVYETARAARDRAEIGRRMGGAHDAPDAPRPVAEALVEGTA